MSAAAAFSRISAPHYEPFSQQNDEAFDSRNDSLLACGGAKQHSKIFIAFRCKEYRANGKVRWKTMTLAPAEFIRRFLIHVLPKGFHRIRHYGPVRQRQSKGHDRARTPIARRRHGGEAERRRPLHDHRRRRCRTAGHGTAAVPLLWWAHAHHRGVRPRPNSPASPIATRAPVLAISTVPECTH
jgi:Putative transposase